jgi:hypothetical protein
MRLSAEASKAYDEAGANHQVVLSVIGTVGKLRSEILQLCGAD